MLWLVCHDDAILPSPTKICTHIGLTDIVHYLYGVVSFVSFNGNHLLTITRLNFYDLLVLNPTPSIIAWHPVGMTTLTP